MNPRTLVYVAGPFTGKGETRADQRADTEIKIKRAEQLGLKVCRLGAYPVIPHCNTSHPEFEDVQPYQFWIDGTGELLLRRDAVIFTDDWQTSSGARGEERLAAEHGIPRFYQLSDLACWLSPELAAAVGSRAPTLSTQPSPPPLHPTLDELARELPTSHRAPSRPSFLPDSPLDLDVTIDVADVEPFTPPFYDGQDVVHGLDDVTVKIMGQTFSGADDGQTFTNEPFTIPEEPLS